MTTIAKWACLHRYETNVCAHTGVVDVARPSYLTSVRRGIACWNSERNDYDWNECCLNLLKTNTKCDVIVCSRMTSKFVRTFHYILTTNDECCTLTFLGWFVTAFYFTFTALIWSRSRATFTATPRWAPRWNCSTNNGTCNTSRAQQYIIRYRTNRRTERSIANNVRVPTTRKVMA